MSYRDKILSLPATRPAIINNNEWFEYQAGHRDARHAAAELALKADATIAELHAEIDRLRLVLLAIATASQTNPAARRIASDALAQVAIKSAEGA